MATERYANCPNNLFEFALSSGACTDVYVDYSSVHGQRTSQLRPPTEARPLSLSAGSSVVQERPTSEAIILTTMTMTSPQALTLLPLTLVQSNHRAPSAATRAIYPQFGSFGSCGWTNCTRKSSMCSSASTRPCARPRSPTTCKMTCKIGYHYLRRTASCWRNYPYRPWRLCCNCPSQHLSG
jgi:hypothetical protein